MPVDLRPLAEEGLAEFIARSNAEYRRERIDSGDSPEYAAERAEESDARYFPGGRPAEGQLLFEVIVPGEAGSDPEVVGVLWVGVVDPVRPAEWWVFDIEIAEEHRGHGYGRAAMLLAERVAAEHGATKLGLNVFGHNTVARGLYDSLGYEVTATNMAKPL
jgi:ribosomal protein S18 acetylase RimI-like enzyme